jgi:hypothetical protein
MYNTLQRPRQEEILESEIRWRGDVVGQCSQLEESLLVRQAGSTFHQEADPSHGRKTHYDKPPALMLTFLQHTGNQDQRLSY